MRVILRHTKHYEWEKLPEGVEPTEGDFKALRCKTMHDGTVRMRVLRERDNWSEVGLHDHDVDDLVKFREDVGRPLTRPQAAIELLVAALPHLTHPAHVTGVEVHGEPEIEAAMRAHFGVKP